METCCNNKLYISDIYCPECGKKITTPITLQSAFMIDPSITDSFYGSGEPYTGKVIDSIYYTRASSNINSGYLWLTLLTTDGEEKQTTIQGESSTFQDIKKGDILSFISPTGINLYHSPTGINKDLIKHDSSPTIYVYHSEDGNNVSYIHNCVSEPAEMYPSAERCTIIAIFSAVVAWLLYSKYQVELISPWFIGACGLPVICLMLASRAVNGNKTKQQLAENANLARDKATDISYQQLGYHNEIRPTSHQDHICQSCNHTVNQEATFCNHCGEKQTTVEEKLALEAVDKSNDISITLDSGEDPDLHKGSKNIREHNQNIFEQYELEDFHTYQHKHTLTSNKEHKVSSSARLVRVLDKHMGVHTDQGVHVTTHTTEYTNRYGDVIDTKERSTYRSYRNIYLNGYLIIEDKNGNIDKFYSNANVLSVTNVDDLILIGESSVKRIDETHYFLEYVYNLNKDKKIVSSETVSNYYPSFPKMSVLNLFLMPVLVFVATIFMIGVLGNNGVAKVAVLGLALVGAVYYFLSPIVFGIKNGSNKKTLLPKLNALFHKCKKNNKEILSHIK